MSSVATLGPNEEKCLTNPEEYKCSSLTDALRTIITRNLYWINTVIIQQYEAKTHEELIFPDNYFNSQRKITVKCVEECKFNSTFTLFARKYEGRLTIAFENIHFIDTTFYVQNLNLQFVFVHLSNTSVRDKSGRPGEFSQVHLEFSNVDFRGEMVAEPFGMLFDSSLSVFVQIKNSQFTQSSVEFVVTSTFLTIDNSSLFATNFLVSAKTTAVIAMRQVLVEHSDLAGGHFCKISSMKIWFELEHSWIRRTSGGVSLEKTFSGRLDSWLRVNINNCTFAHNTKLGSGAAVEIVFHTSKSSGQNIVRVAFSSFLNNVAQREGYISSKGGALSFEKLGNNWDETWIILEILSCIFANNKAAGGGGAVFVSKTLNELHIQNCSFVLKLAMFLSPKAAFLWSNGLTSIEDSEFVYTLDTFDTSLIELIVPSEVHQRSHLLFTLVCLPWTKLTVLEAFSPSTLTGEVLMQELRTRCSPCSPSFYAPSLGVFSLSFTGNETVTRIQDVNNKMAKSLPCVDCPYGGDCPGTTLRAKPNFWGYSKDDEVLFVPCPVSYCCVASAKVPCQTYNACSSNRAGTLCGVCKAGFALSLLSNNCLPESQCTSSWVWPFASLTAALYMLWYTFKDDILQVPSFLSAKIRRKDPAQLDDVDKGYFGILTYFVQASATLTISVPQESGFQGGLLLQINKYLGVLLSIEVTNISADLCPYVGLTLTKKYFLKLAFLSSIFVWSFVTYSGIFVLSAAKLKKCVSFAGFVSFVRKRQVGGFVEIIKYTYSGFASLAFTSLLCVPLGTQSIWFFDGTVQCMNSWQMSMLLLCFGFVIPFPFILPFGLWLLKKQAMSSRHFILGCMCPIVSLVLWPLLCKKNFKSAVASSHHQQGAPKKTVESLSEESVDFRIEILTGFQGPYKTSRGETHYWESVMILRRLLLTATTLIPHPVFQVGTCGVLCLVFFWHHLYAKPFCLKNSNSVESLSLFMLTGSAMVNLIKATFVQLGIYPEGPNVQLVDGLLFFDDLQIVFLLCFIILLEFWSIIKK